jgi:hypothetical protein
MLDLTPKTLTRFSSKGILVDANLLYLLILGIYDRTQIPTNQRTSQYVEEDFDLLVTFLDRFRNIITVPNVLTEVSNLSTKFDITRRKLFLEFFRNKITLLEERYVTSKNASKDDAFSRLGITDTAITVVASQKNLILTDDLNLYLHLMNKGYYAINFNHIRAQGWKQ